MTITLWKWDAFDQNGFCLVVPLFGHYSTSSPEDMIVKQYKHCPSDFLISLGSTTQLQLAT